MSVRAATRLWVAGLGVALALRPDPAHGAERPRFGGVLVVAGREAPGPSLDPLELGGGALSGTLSRALYDTLFRPGPDQRAVPWLVSESAPDAELKSWDLTLKPGLEFHDGRPLSAGDVAFSLERFFASPVSRGGCFAPEAARVARLTEIARLKVRIELDSGCPSLPDVLADPRAAIVPAVVPQPGVVPPPVGGIGSGPFRLASEQPGEWVLEANDASSAGRPFLDRVSVRRVAVASEVETALRIGAIDLAVGRTRGGAVGARFRAGGEDTVFLVLSRSVAPFDSPPVRRAVAAAVDRPSIATVMLSGHARVACSALPESRAAYRSLLAVPARDGAAALGGERRAGLALGLARDDAELVAIADRVQADLQEAGLSLRVVAVDERDGAARLADGQLAAWLTSRSFQDGATADALARAMASLRPPASIGALGFAAAASRARGLDGALREALAAERALADDAVWIPLVHRDLGVETAPGVEASDVCGDGAVRLESVWRRPAAAGGATLAGPARAEGR